MTRVSIIIPLYNKEEYIWNTLNSVRTQIFSDWEGIIIDDGSTDGSLDIVNRFIDEFSGNWRVITQVNSGQAIARNVGMSKAKGELIAFLDADDLWPQDKLSKQVSALDDNPTAIAVLSSYAIFKNNDSPIRVVRHPSIEKMMMRWLDMSGFGGGLESVGLVRTSEIEGVGLFDPSFSTSSGLDFSLRLFANGNILILKEVGLFYRLSEGQWHGNVQELARNAEKLQLKYSNIYHRHLSKSHSAYFFWTTARQQGGIQILLKIFGAILRPTNGRFRMLASLSSRNLTSRIRGRLFSKQLHDSLAQLETRKIT